MAEAKKGGRPRSADPAVTVSVSMPRSLRDHLAGQAKRIKADLSPFIRALIKAGLAKSADLARDLRDPVPDPAPGPQPPLGVCSFCGAKAVPEAPAEPEAEADTRGTPLAQEAMRAPAVADYGETD